MWAGKIDQSSTTYRTNFQGNGDLLTDSDTLENTEFEF
jgi:hypothetical protein